MRISDWSSDVCSSDLSPPRRRQGDDAEGFAPQPTVGEAVLVDPADGAGVGAGDRLAAAPFGGEVDQGVLVLDAAGGVVGDGIDDVRSEEHTSELQSLMRISYAVFCLKKKTKKHK